MRLIQFILLFLSIQFSASSLAFLTPAEFDQLNDNGTINPAELRFSQDSASECFSDRRSVHTLIDELRNDETDANDIPPIRIVKVDPAAIIRPGGTLIAAGVYTLDNRRLYAFQHAGVAIRYTKLNHIPENQRFKFTTNNNGTDIILRQVQGGC